MILGIFSNVIIEFNCFQELFILYIGILMYVQNVGSWLLICCIDSWCAWLQFWLFSQWIDYDRLVQCSGLFKWGHHVFLWNYNLSLCIAVSSLKSYIAQCWLSKDRIVVKRTTLCCFFFSIWGDFLFTFLLWLTPYCWGLMWSSNLVPLEGWMLFWQCESSIFYQVLFMLLSIWFQKELNINLPVSAYWQVSSYMCWLLYAVSSNE